MASPSVVEGRRPGRGPPPEKGSSASARSAERAASPFNASISRSGHCAFIRGDEAGRGSTFFGDHGAFTCHAFFSGNHAASSDTTFRDDCFSGGPTFFGCHYANHMRGFLVGDNFLHGQAFLCDQHTHGDIVAFRQLVGDAISKAGNGGKQIRFFRLLLHGS